MSVTNVVDLHDYERLLGENQFVVVDFGASWCGPCRMIKPIYHELSEQEEYQKVKFLAVDIDEGDEIAEKNDINSVPTFKFFLNGEEASSFSGASRDLIVQHLAKLLEPVPGDSGEDDIEKDTRDE